MIIDKNTWHYKWFMWWAWSKYTSNGRYCKDSYHNASDSYIIKYLCGTLTLCTYMKVVLLYAPLRYIFTNTNIRLIAGNIAIFLLVYIELTNPMINAEMFFVSTCLIGTAILIGLVFLVALCGEQLWSDVVGTLDSTAEKVICSPFSSVLVEYYKAKKEKICPFIKFKE